MSSRICGPNTLNLVITLPHEETERRKLYNKRLHPRIRNVAVAKNVWQGRTYVKGQFMRCTSFLIRVITTNSNKHDNDVDAIINANVRLWCILKPQGT